MPGLFDPFVVRNHTLKNRIVMAPMGTRMANAEGEVTDRQIGHYAKRAAGNVGLVIVENAFVHRSGQSRKHQLAISHDGLIPGLRRLASAIREEGASPGIQIGHVGLRAKAAVIGEQPLSPSGVVIADDWYGETVDMPRPLREDEMADIAGYFAAAAVRAVQAGFDVVDIHGAHGFLLSQFLSPLTNQRTDSYGGDIRGRATLPCEVVAAVRKTVGDDLPLFYRLGADDFLPGGLTAEEGQQAAKALVEAGVDVVDVSGGISGSGRDVYTERGYFVPLAEGVKRVANAPVVVAGNLRDPEYADRVVREGRIDLVAIGRGLLENPLWAVRAAEQLGRRQIA